MSNSKVRLSATRLVDVVMSSIKAKGHHTTTFPIHPLVVAPLIQLDLDPCEKRYMTLGILHRLSSMPNNDQSFPTIRVETAAPRQRRAGRCLHRVLA